MSLKKIIEDDLGQAIKDRNEIVLDTLRLFKAVLQNAEIEKKEELSDEKVAELISRQLKKHKDSIEEFEKAERNDLSEREKKQAEVLKKYLPKQLSDDELKKIASKVIKDKNIASAKQFGQVMGEVMKQVKGRADGNKVKSVVEEVVGNL